MVDYYPRYPQPFTFSDAVQFDVSTITEEISRLQNSLSCLRQTQDLLREAMDSDPSGVDIEVKAAFEENQQVMYSDGFRPAQEERITILQLALAEKGVVTGSHYDLPPSLSSGKESVQRPTQATADENDNDQGIHL
ncbi:hypothetical protein L218DRAFT_854067 [Marasmius fiardii PR-910]|nr:hypothetical protein L218DRAFT_854067 [Marasmius fiardii PR-910]